MIVLTQTTDKIQVVLGGPVSTSQLQCVASWRDITDTPTYTPGRTVVTTNNTTDVDVVGAPAGSTQRVVDFISVHNADTATATVTVKFDANGTEYILWIGQLAPSERMVFTEKTGWSTLSSTGNTLSTNRRLGFSAIESSTSISALTWTTAVFSVEQEDTDNAWDGSVFTVPRTGMYDISGVYAFTSVNDASKFIVALGVNGTTATHLIGRGVSGGTALCGAGGAIKLQLTAGNTLRMLVYVDNATSGFATTPGYCSFSAYLM